MQHEAYWIAPNGEILPLQAMERHIQMICNYPERFGLTEEYTKRIYTKYRESYGTEGFARAEIMKALLEKGWIRIRYVQKWDFYKAEVLLWNDSLSKNLNNWISKLIGGEFGKVNMYSEIKILLNGEFIKTLKLEDFDQNNFE